MLHPALVWLRSRGVSTTVPPQALSAGMADEESWVLTHTTSCAMIPPEDGEAWRQMQVVRESLRDAGLYRWPPHCNLIYPMVPAKRFDDVLPFLQEACKKVPPFRVRLAECGVFGGARRGVLWLRPDVVGGDDSGESPLVALQRKLRTALSQPEKNFVPHLTLSHFESAEAALRAAETLEWTPVDFVVDEVHVMARQGDDGQFTLYHRLPLGGCSLPDSEILPRPFRGMPAMPFEWTDQARDLLRARRGRSSSGRPRRRRRRRSPEERARIAARTPEEIEVIRAERARRKGLLAATVEQAAQKTPPPPPPPPPPEHNDDDAEMA
ncbi:hypothetical protein CTAYLR_008380 [Chrysophaeum taylorii]|uniref:Uncharacterized protein n=1 Tax=Chrysophaeum taylorii TaxID=2483200 RepID=A0AAD7XNP2_9STRA|nr:hypothetical protein CTAYLR_008380 [Chrysophaeum taylorii]